MLLFQKSKTSNHKVKGFTIIELLVSVTIVATIAAVSLSSVSLFKRRAMMAKEMTAARNLMVAFNMFSNDNDGKIDSEDEDEFGEPREFASKIAVAKIAEDIINDIMTTW